MSEQDFEWDETKNLENQQKHGVTFYEAQHAFLDTNRVIAEDLVHSQAEKRYYCFGLNEQGNGILNSHCSVYLSIWLHPYIWCRLLAQR